METNLTALVKDFSASIDLGINPEVHTKDADPDSLILNNLTTITLKTVITSPEDRKGMELILDV